MRHRRGVSTLAALGLVAVTGSAVGGLAWSVVVGNGDTAVLGTIASIGVGSLASLAGAKSLTVEDRKNTDDSNK